MDWEFEVVAGPLGDPTDGPVWDGEGLFFTQLAIPANTINNRVLRYDPSTGEVSDYRRWTNRVVGLAFSADGTLYGCQSASRRVVRFNQDGSTSPMALWQPYRLAAGTRRLHHYSGFPLPGQEAEHPQRYRGEIRQHHLLHRPLKWNPDHGNGMLRYTKVYRL